MATLCVATAAVRADPRELRALVDVAAAGAESVPVCGAAPRALRTAVTSIERTGNLVAALCCDLKIVFHFFIDVVVSCEQWRPQASARLLQQQVSLLYRPPKSPLHIPFL